MIKVKLRQYQINFIEAIKSSFRSGKRHICGILPCRAGKSVIAAMIAKGATDKGNNVIFLVHRKELCKQIEATFKAVGVNMWVCKIEMVQSFKNKMQNNKNVKLIIIDEYHHSVAPTYKKIISYYPKALILGFTATPVLLSKKGLDSAGCQELVHGVTAKWLIDNEFMADYDYYNNKLIDTENVKITAGEYNKHDLDILMDDNIVYVGAVQNYLKFANGKQAIVYCTDVSNAKHTAKEFNDNGIKAGFITGSQASIERLKAMSDFKSGNIQILTSCEVISEGIDIADCDCCILLRPTKSLSLFIQQSMRCLTYKEGKRAIILDLVGNYNEHGTPTQERNWSLNGTLKQEITTRQCEVCFNVYERKLKICPFCGAKVETKTRDKEQEEKEAVIAELEKINKSLKVLLKYTDCTTWEELDNFRKKKKYKWGWQIFKAKELEIEIPEKYIKWEKQRRKHGKTE